MIEKDDLRLTNRFRPEEPFNPNRIETMADVIEVWELIAEGAKEGNLQQRNLGEIKELRDNFILSRSIDNKEIRGIVGLDVYTKRLAEIRSLYVKPEYRRFGIGTVLVQQALNRARNLNIPEIITITDKVEMFKKAGFNEILNNQRALFIRFEKGGGK